MPGTYNARHVYHLTAGGRSLATTESATSPVDLDASIDIDRLGPELAVELYRRMKLVREFEERVSRLFLQGKIPGTIHLSMGQEACAVGGTSPLRETDRITVTHRGHGQALAKGVTARKMMAELFARETGCCRGSSSTVPASGRSWWPASPRAPSPDARPGRADS